MSAKIFKYKADTRIAAEVKRTIANSIALAAETGQLPHEFLLAIMRGDGVEHTTATPVGDGKDKVLSLSTEKVYADIETRIELAKELLPYFAPKLSAAQITLDTMNGGDGERKEKRLAGLAGRLVDLQRRVVGMDGDVYDGEHGEDDDDDEEE